MCIQLSGDDSVLLIMTCILARSSCQPLCQSGFCCNLYFSLLFNYFLITISFIYNFLLQNFMYLVGESLEATLMFPTGKLLSSQDHQSTGNKT